MSADETKDKVWASPYNSQAKLRPESQRKVPVRFYDTTLRDGEQTVGVVFTPQQKVEIALQLAELGVGRIEAGFPRVSPDDAEAFRLITAANPKAEVWGFARAVSADIDMLIELGARATVIESPTSRIKLDAYGIAPEELLRRVTTSIRYAKEHGMTVAYFAVDATRSELDFLKQVYLAALEAGADEVVVVDTIGACNPEAVEFLVGQVREWVGESVPIHFHGHNDFGLATASAVAAVRAGATWIHGTINGMGERAGNADIGEIALALSCLYDVPVELDLGKIRAVSQLVQKISGHTLDAWRPLVGENLFTRESGAVASQFHIPEAIEPYSSELVNAERAIVLGKKSGLDSIDLKCKELGLPFTAEQRPAILKEVKRKGIEKRGLLTDDEFRAIVANVQKS